MLGADNQRRSGVLLRVADRFRAAEAFLASLAKFIPDLNAPHRDQAGAEILAARQRLVASLGKHGENNIATFTTWLILAAAAPPVHSGPLGSQRGAAGSGVGRPFLMP